MIAVTKTERAAVAKDEPLYLDEEQDLAIPESALTFDGFCDWACSDDYPEKARISWIGEEIFIEMNAEQANSHVSVKQAFNRVIDHLAVDLDLGVYFPVGVRIVQSRAKVSNMPDACLINRQAIRDGRVKLRHPKFSDSASIEGSPDWVLEILSRSSIRKDTVVLKERYFKAGVKEYWLVDARRKERIDFQIFVRGKSGFVSQPKTGGWVSSPLFGRRFSLQRRSYEGDFWRFDLSVSSSGR